VEREELGFNTESTEEVEKRDSSADAPQDRSERKVGLLRSE